MRSPVLMMQRWKIDTVGADDAVPHMSSRWKLRNRHTNKSDEQFCALKAEILASDCFTVILNSDVLCCEFVDESGERLCVLVASAK